MSSLPCTTPGARRSIRGARPSSRSRRSSCRRQARGRTGGQCGSPRTIPQSRAWRPRRRVAATSAGKSRGAPASACSSARILLNSKSKQHPNGLGNNSDLVGRYLHDSTGGDMMAFIPKLIDRKTYNEDGVGGMHVYSPWWLDNKNLDFARGYHIEVWGGLGAPSYLSLIHI